MKQFMLAIVVTLAISSLASPQLARLSLQSVGGPSLSAPSKILSPVSGNVLDGTVGVPASGADQTKDIVNMAAIEETLKKLEEELKVAEVLTLTEELEEVQGKLEQVQ
ncbi:unnamed protein product [Allacma fusca]|uniref:Uncharacterized protein n=1 Tax=Allacma fusca TaxID=39272 RepID=A0A8J2PSC7_9HEXA|nr:unnamed protein product [Allacma fusca]